MAKLFLGSKHTDWSPHLLRLLWAIEAGLVGLLGSLSRLLPPDTASAAGRRLMTALGPRLDKTDLIRRNLEIAFPDLDEAQTRHLIRGIWGNLGSVLAEYPHLERIANDAGQRLEIIIKGNPQVFSNTGKPAVFVSAHLANWELVSHAVVKQGISAAAVYTRLQNPWLDRMLFRARRLQGRDLVERDNAARQLIRCLKQGTSVGLIVDQRVDTGEPVSFFGHDMLTSITPAQLALRFDCELIPVQVERLHGARFRVTFHAPVSADDENTGTAEKVLQMTARINALFESWIRAHPDQWMCTKRRWPKYRRNR